MRLSVAAVHRGITNLPRFETHRRTWTDFLRTCGNHSVSCVPAFIRIVAYLSDELR